jgi:ribosomal 50S subunit-recycling heat shock protein
MRIDKFLNAVNITKRRAIAQDMLKSGVVSINGIAVKQSKEVKLQDIIEITFLNGQNSKYKVIEIPRFKTTPKSEQLKYIEIIK